MSIATQSLKYGWVALATLTIGAGTIFVAPSVLRRITLKDRIEVTLAIVERCLATQTGTNPATYGVDPPSIVRTWTDANGASVIMTNAIAWRDDLSMKIELDATLEALCPYYVDTNSVYDGTTNIIMHTFTGLLTSLDLGDHTNFTAIPAIGTNIATYGPWAWRNYVVAWQERYKVLEALKLTNPGNQTYTKVTVSRSIAVGNYWSDPKSYRGMYNIVITNVPYIQTNHPYYPWDTFVGLTYEGSAVLRYDGNTSGWYFGGEVARSVKITAQNICTQIQSTGAAYVFADEPDSIYHNYMYQGPVPFFYNEYGLQSNVWNLVTVSSNDFLLFDPHLQLAPSGSDPGFSWLVPIYTNSYDVGDTLTGFRIRSIYALRNWQFNYATNAYWE